jgi:hypothetical protein
MNHDHYHPQHKHPFQLLEGRGSLPSTPQEQRRAVLWRQRMKLEFEMQGLFVRSATLVQEWQYLHGSKEAVGNEVSKIASHIVLAGFVGLHQERTAWQHSYEGDHIALEEIRIQHTEPGVPGVHAWGGMASPYLGLGLDRTVHRYGT